MNLKSRFSLIFAGFTLFILMMFGVTYYIVEQRAALQAQLAEQVRLLKTLAGECAAMHLAANPMAVMKYIQGLQRIPTIASAACLDISGAARVHSDPHQIGALFSDPDFLKNIDLSGVRSRMRRGPGATPWIEWAAPVLVGNRKIGWAILAFDRHALDAEIHERLWTTLRQLSLVAGATFLLAVGVGLAMAWSLSKPIAALVRAAGALETGELGYQTPVAERTDELGHLARRFNQMSKSLAELDELKDEFIHNVSHDLRNPMSAIKMYVDYMLNQEPDRDKLLPKHRNVFTMIMDCATRLNVYVTNILDSAKIKAGKMEYHIQPVLLEATMRSVYNIFNIIAQQRQIEFKLELEQNFPKISSDPERLEQVLSNLVSNALKFTHEDGKIILGARHNNLQAEIYVEDTGVGIDKEDIPNLFQKFQQSSVVEQKNRGIHGTGLGLYLVKQTVEAMGGSVSMSSEKNKGTRFTLKIPLAEA